MMIKARAAVWIAAVGVSLVLAAPASAQQSGTRGSGFAYDPATGLLTQEVVEPDLSQFRLQTDYIHDAFGNRTSVTVSGVDITTRSATTTFDARGQFAVTQTNALSQSESWVHDGRFGQPVSHTGPNGLTTTWEYDGFGRKTLELRADGTRTTWSYRYCSGIAGGTDTCPEGAVFLVEANVLGSDGATPIAPKAIAYHDKLGRPIAADTEGFDGSTIRSVTEYDELGREKRTSRPYFLAGGAPVYQSVDYDVLSRPVLQTTFDGTTLQFSYHGLTITVTNALGQSKLTIKNSQGEIVSVTDAAGETMTYGYDPFGNMLEARDPVGNVTSHTYDRRGRKLTWTDPDRGLCSYTYDVLDQLLTKTDAKGQVTSFSYDLLGRTIERAEPTLTSNWTYDTAPKGIGKPATASTNGGYQRSHSYDALGRPDQTTLTIDAVAYSYTTTYDGNGRVDQVSYPSGLAVAYSYNALGYQTQLANVATSEVYWTADARDAELRLTQQTAGNGVTTSHSFDPLMGRLTATQSGPGGTVQNFAYGYDAIGNVESREDLVNSWSESFTYDVLNRLTSATVGIDIAKSFAYDPIGNLLSKSDVGNYAYPSPGQPFPHAVSSISGSVINTTFSYDANGNMTSGNGLAISYTAFNKPETITRGSNQVVFFHDSEHARIKQTGVTGETLYLNGGGAMSEKLIGSGGTTQWTDYLFAGGEMIGMRVEHSVSGVYTRYFHKDHLGSISTITDETGAVVERLSYDAWGKRRNIDGTDDPTGSIASQTTRGFTGHEQLTEVGLVHMNGRVYDPLLGRFGAPDPMTESPYSTQGWNRYSYVGNSPLNFSDPTGYCFLGCFWQKPFQALGGALRRIPILGNILTVAGAALCGPGAFVCVGLVSAAVTGLASGDLGAALKAGIISAVTAFAFNVMGDITGHNPAFGTTNHLANIAGHAAVGCASAVASGGKCGPGALSGAVGSFTTPLTRGLDFTSRLVVTSVSGGLASVAGGGKFGNGAVTAAFGYLFNMLAEPLGWLGSRGGAVVGGGLCAEGGPLAVVCAIGGAQIGRAIGSGIGGWLDGILWSEGTPPPDLSPEGAGRRGAFNEAKRQNGIPTSQQPDSQGPNFDKRGNRQPGRRYEFNVNRQGGSTSTVTIRDDAAGHSYGPNNPQNRGPHFNDPLGRHFDY